MSQFILLITLGDEYKVHVSVLEHFLELEVHLTVDKKTYQQLVRLELVVPLLKPK